MEFSQVIQLRRSIRKFKLTPIPAEYITEILNTARLAPSVSNIQSTRFVVLKTPEAISLLQGYTTPFVTKAPVVIICCIDLNSWKEQANKLTELVDIGVFKDNKEDEIFYEDLQNNGDIAKTINEKIATYYLWQHAAIAMDHMILKATDLGLGSCWIGLVDRVGVKKQLGIDDKYEIVALLPIGYADQDPRQRPRYNLNKLILKEI